MKTLGSKGVSKNKNYLVQKANFNRYNFINNKGLLTYLFGLLVFEEPFEVQM